MTLDWPQSPMSARIEPWADPLVMCELLLSYERGAGGIRIGERHGEVLESRLEAGIAENVPRREEWLFACLHRLHTLRDFA
jgi:hypothetical protein